MNPETVKKGLKLTKNNIIVISSAAFAILFLAGVILYLIWLKSDKIYKDVFINEVYAGNLSKAELADKLNHHIWDKVGNAGFTLKHGEATLKIDFSDIKVKYDIDAAVEQAYSVGRTGNILKMALQLVKLMDNDTSLNVPFTYDKDQLEKITESFGEKSLTRVKQAELVIEDDRTLIRTGHTGESVDKKKLVDEIKKIIAAYKGDGIIEIPITKVKPEKMNLDDYFNKINCEPTDAFVKIENNHAITVPHKFGRKIDKVVLNSIVTELEGSEDVEKVLPVVYKKPKLTSDEIKAKLFKDVLSSYSTQFSTDTKNNKNREVNIKIAVSKINGKILAPGETFSFNDVVGERTEEGGYKDAYIYVGGKVIPGTGGGICQVSSTLFNSVLPLDLEVVERNNHMFTVSYTPLGMDAAVSYGELDFKFKNSFNWPVKILGKVSDHRIYFTIMGTNENLGKTVAYYTKTLKTMYYKSKYIMDPSLNEGQTEIRHIGYKGYIVDTYKIVRKDGKELSNTKIYTSVYTPLDEEVVVGVKKTHL